MLDVSPEILIWSAVMFVFSGIDAAVKTYQNRNINTHNYSAVWPTGYLQTATWAIGIYAVTYNDFNLIVLFCMATGGVLGCQGAMYLHGRKYGEL